MLITQENLQPNKTQFTRSQLALPSLLIGVLILSFSAIFTRLSEQEIGPAAISFNRYFIAVITLLMWDRIQSLGIYGLFKPEEKITVKDWISLIISAIVGTATNIFWALSLTQTSVANSNLLHNLTPIFATLGAWLFLSQSFDFKFLLGMVLALIGATTIGWEDFQANANSLNGDTLALLSAVFYAANYLIREQLRYKFSAATILFWPCLFSCFLTLCVTLTTENQIFPLLWPTWLAVICLGILSQIFGQGLIIYSLKQFPSSFVTLLMLLEPLLTAVFAWFIFDEPLTLLNWVAFFLVLAGIYITKQSKNSEKKTVDGHTNSTPVLQ